MKNLSNPTNPDLKSPQYFIDRLDYSISDSKERAEFVKNLIGGETSLETYFNQAALQHKENGGQNIGRCLEILADYIMMSSSNVLSKSKLKRLNQNAVSMDNLDENEAAAVMMAEAKNFYKIVKQKITAGDLKDEELKDYLLPLMDYKAQLQKRRNAAKKDGNGKLRYRLDKIIGSLNQDMIDIKNLIKRPINFKHAITPVAQINWLECDYTNFEHIKELMIISEKGLINDLGVLTNDMTEMIKKAGLTKTERKIIGFIRNNNTLTQAELATELGVSQPHISATIKSAALKIVKYNLSKPAELDC